MKQPQARAEDCIRAMAELWPRVIQGNVRVLDDYVNAKRCTVRFDGEMLMVILEVECVDGELWAHLSASNMQKQRVPNWRELRWCKEYFLGDRKAVQVLPPRDQYVNINPHVLHLYTCLERDPLPDFRMADPTTGQLAI
jgi:hypothetical protein